MTPERNTNTDIEGAALTVFLATARKRRSATTPSLSRVRSCSTTSATVKEVGFCAITAKEEKSLALAVLSKEEKRH